MTRVEKKDLRLPRPKGTTSLAKQCRMVTMASVDDSLEEGERL